MNTPVITNGKIVITVFYEDGTMKESHEVSATNYVNDGCRVFIYDGKLYPEQYDVEDEILSTIRDTLDGLDF